MMNFSTLKVSLIFNFKPFFIGKGVGGGSPGSFDDEGPPVNFNPTKSVRFLPNFIRNKCKLWHRSLLDPPPMYLVCFMEKLCTKNCP